MVDNMNPDFHGTLDAHFDREYEEYHKIREPMPLWVRDLLKKAVEDYE